MLAVGGAGHHDRVAASPSDRPAHPVGEVDLPVVAGGAGRPGPHSRSRARRRNGDSRTIWLRQQGSHLSIIFVKDHTGTIGDVRGGLVMPGTASARPPALGGGGWGAVAVQDAAVMRADGGD